MSPKKIFLIQMIFFALVIAVTVFELTRAEISLTSDTANLIFLIEAGFFALIAISGYFSTRKTFRCPNCHADFSMKHVQSVGDTPLFECVECGEREYIQMDHGGGVAAAMVAVRRKNKWE